ncbi:MAG: hypothetical protein GC205_01715 [Bacteroidetes bacterium]|nr:hypothetical protein [Bacteroidota bacterium]
MRRVIATFLTAVMLCFGRASQGQGHDSHWVFGNGNHLEFTAGGPEVRAAIVGYSAFEAATAISDQEGELVLFSNNVQFWGSDLNIIAGTDSLNPGPSGINGSTRTNACIALPWPGDSSDNLFVVIYTNELSGKVHYSLFDKTLNGGKTGLVSGVVNLSVWKNEVAESVTAIRHGNGRDWWVIARTYGNKSDSILVALMDPTGITYHNDYSIGFEAVRSGEMSPSPMGDQLAISFSADGGSKFFGVFEFNRCDGSIQILDTLLPSVNGGFYGVTYSLDGESIYANSTSRHKLYKIQLSAGVLTDSLLYTFPGEDFFINQGGQLQLAPDGKVYQVNVKLSASGGLPIYPEFLAVINEPNRGVLYCAFDTFGVYLDGLPTIGVYSLPNFANYNLGPLVGSPCDTLSPQDTTQTSIQPVFPIQGEWSITPSISSGWYQLNSTKEGWLLVQDLYGREVVRRWFSGTTPFDLTGLPAGVYVATVAIEGSLKQKVQRLLKQ